MADRWWKKIWISPQPIPPAEGSTPTAGIQVTNTCPYRKLCPAVLMVQATEDRYRSDAPDPLDGAEGGSVLPQR
jgi:hypothetical protein